MKKAFFTLCLVAIGLASQAQTFKSFKAIVGTGYAIPGGSGAKGGVLFYLEPMYNVSDKISAGLRMEWAAMARGYSEDIGDTDLKISTSGSYTLNGQYYFNTNGFRPFVGLGLGMYTIKAATFDNGSGGTSTFGSDETKFGFYPRIGFDASHFNMTIDYNIVGATKYEGTDVKSKNSYIGIRVGVAIGGGRK
jgi:OmpW family